MISFFSSILLLVLGYVVYGRVIEGIFGVCPELATPAIEKNDGVDYVPMKTWKIVMIQFLNIAGTGPIYGAIMGACFGPQVFLWIVFGSIFAGAVHDYFSGMMSVRFCGSNLPEIVKCVISPGAQLIMRIFCIALLVLVGAVFTIQPSSTIAYIFNFTEWTPIVTFLVIAYYFLSTILPVDKLIGRIYPVFSFFLLIMCVLLLITIFNQLPNCPEITDFQFGSGYKLPAWPFMFVTVACGAVSGFHSTQSPIMARCIKNEKEGRVVFYGSMILEGIVALIWAAAGVTLYSSGVELGSQISQIGPAAVISNILSDNVEGIGAILGILGVIVCPISSGDTALRSCRMIVNRWINLDSSKFKNRIIVTLPILLVCYLITFVDFSFVWRYFSFCNQLLAAIVLICATIYLIRYSKNKYCSFFCAIPAAFMVAVSFSYIIAAPEGFRMPVDISTIIGCSIAGLVFFYLIYRLCKQKYRESIPELN